MPNLRRRERDKTMEDPHPSSLLKHFSVIAVPGMYLYYKYNEFKRQRLEDMKRKVAERELDHLNQKIIVCQNTNLLVTNCLFLTILITSTVKSNLSRHTIDPCDNYYCANGGTCVSKSDIGYRRNCRTIPTCQCAGSWKGERCEDNPCDVIECNTGTCNVDGTGSPSCLCPPGCTGEACADDDDSECVSADGQCIHNETCGEWATLKKPCCNEKVCCLQEFKEVIVCDGNFLRLRCADGIVNIKSAIYGRDDLTTCPHSDIQTETCSASVVDLVSGWCNGTILCDILIPDMGLPDPCPGTHKFLRVIYGCFN